MPRYYVHDLEADKLLIYTAGKSDWLSLPEAVRDSIKRCCLWSGSRNCWVNRRKGAYIWCLDALKANGFEDRGTTGERLTFAEQVAAEQEKAEARADRMEARAEKAGAEAESRFTAAHNIVKHIPMGQPILVGHHSERRHRSDLAKHDNNMRKGIEAESKRDHYQRRAEAARGTADGSIWSDPRYLGARIQEAEAEERKFLRMIKQRATEEDAAAYMERDDTPLARVRDKLGYLRHCLETCGVTVYTKETLKGKTAVKIRGRWELIVRLDPTTVAVPNICFSTEESQRKWALKYAYTEVQDAR